MHLNIFSIVRMFSDFNKKSKLLIGIPGIEPGIAAHKTDVIPFHHTPINIMLFVYNIIIIYLEFIDFFLIFNHISFQI